MGSLVPVHPVAVTIGFHVVRESYVCSLAWHGTDAEASIFREPSAFARIMTRSNSAKEPKSVGFGACDSPLEGAGFEPSVPLVRSVPEWLKKGARALCARSAEMRAYS